MNRENGKNDYYVIRNAEGRYLKIRTGGKRAWVNGTDGATVGTQEQMKVALDDLNDSPYHDGCTLEVLGSGSSAWMVKNDVTQERKRIGQRIAQLRKERGMTQQDLAERTGMQQGNIARIEAGRYSARFDTLQAIAEAMGLTVDFVAGCQ